MKNIKVIRIATTQPPEGIDLEEYLNNIVGITFKKSINKGENVDTQLSKHNNKALLRNVLDQNHGSVLEHVYITYAIVGASRSYLAQQTRHRMFNYTSSSQHYIDHTEMCDAEIPVEILDIGNEEIVNKYIEGYNAAKKAYDELVASGVDHAVARQLLPNAQRNTLLVTGNVRSWINFMNQRLCFRNTSEILYIAKLILDDMKEILPVCAEYMVPDCVKYGHCTQKAMSCGNKWTKEKLDDKFKGIK